MTSTNEAHGRETTGTKTYTAGWITTNSNRQNEPVNTDCLSIAGTIDEDWCSSAGGGGLAVSSILAPLFGKFRQKNPNWNKRPS